MGCDSFAAHSPPPMRALLLLLPFAALACQSSTEQAASLAEPQVTGWDSSLIQVGEKHFKHLKQLTFGGDNAEAYWSFDGTRLIFQSSNPAWGESCDQIHVFSPFTDDLRMAKPALISLGGGRTTCSYFLPGDSLVLFASTHEADAACPAVPAPRADHKYVWPIYPSFDIYVSDLKGGMRRKLTDTPGYDAEATVSPKGDRIVFTSMRDGDMDLYTMNIDGTDVRRVTNTLGYDGGAFFSPDGTKLLWRASRPTAAEEEAEYKALLKEGLVMPTNMELYVANADGTDARRITALGKANWAPFWHPSGRKVIFASNHTSERGFPFTLYLVNLDGSGLEQVSFGDTFDAFPVFSPNGRYLVFSSNRNNGGTRETNLFLAEWAD
jgi:Tol biopolymer transport system component